MSLQFDDIHNNVTRGKVSIAGFGPGNPELLTIKTHKALKTADVVFYDDLLDASYLDNYKAEKVYVGKRRGNHAYSQAEINNMLLEAALEGKNVLRLKGGDPLIFGRGIEEYNFLAERNVEVELVPGISSAMAAAADALVSLTARGVSSSLAFVSGHDLEKLIIPRADTLVVYMGASNQKPLAKLMIEQGWDEATPLVVVRNASYKDAQTRRYTLRSLQESMNLLPSPAIMIIGWTAAETSQQLSKTAV